MHIHMLAIIVIRNVVLFMKERHQLKAIIDLNSNTMMSDHMVGFALLTYFILSD